MRFNFDMDGTIANLYGVENWLNYLINEEVEPYIQAKPLVNMNKLAKRLNEIQNRGDEIVIISWASKNCSPRFVEAIAQAKREWLQKYLPTVRWNEIIIIQYGEPKSNYSYGILFDDEEPNRNEWGKGAYEPSRIFEILK